MSGKKQYSIKTVDGNRYDLPVGEIPMGYSKLGTQWLMFTTDNITTRFILASNVVCITEKEIEDE